MDIEDDIRKGIEEVRRQKAREQQQAAEQECQAQKRAAHAAGLWPYLERYREAMRAERDPASIECTKPRMFRGGSKVVDRNAWLVSRHSGGVDNIGQRITFNLWFDDLTPDLWWQETGFPARCIKLGENNPDLSPAENLVLEEAEKDLPMNLGRRAERNGIDLIAPGG
jgi:hypothetical protein